MPRPRKLKRCCYTPVDRVFKPRSIPMSELEQIVLSIEQMETVCLCDLEGLDQETAGRRMGVSRGTVQRDVNQARRAIADALISGKALVLEETRSSQRVCPRRRARRPGEER